MPQKLKKQKVQEPDADSSLNIYFIIRKEQLSASFCLFWFGKNILNISKYVANTRSMGLAWQAAEFTTGISC